MFKGLQNDSKMQLEKERAATGVKETENHEKKASLKNTVDIGNDVTGQPLIVTFPAAATQPCFLRPLVAFF